MQGTATATSRFSHAALALGALALVLVVVHFFAGPFAPVQSTGTSVGELAAEIRDAGARALRGEAQPVAARPWDADRILALVAAALGGLAVALGVVGFVQHEPRRAVIGGIALGSAAIVFQFFAWLALAILGVMIVMAVIQAIGIDIG